MNSFSIIANWFAYFLTTNMTMWWRKHIQFKDNRECRHNTDFPQTLHVLSFYMRVVFVSSFNFILFSGLFVCVFLVEGVVTLSANHHRKRVFFYNQHTRRWMYFFFFHFGFTKLNYRNTGRFTQAFQISYMHLCWITFHTWIVILLNFAHLPTAAWWWISQRLQWSYKHPSNYNLHKIPCLDMFDSHILTWKYIFKI